jgi:hypothetical protein
MALKAREAREEGPSTTKPELVAEQETAVDTEADDGEPDIDVEHDGNEVTVRQNTPGTRGQRRAAEREAKLVERISAPLRDQIATITKTLETLSSRQVQPVLPLQQQQQRPAKQDEDALDPDYLDVVRQQDELAERVKRCRTQEEVDAVSDKWHRLERKRILLLQPKAAQVAEQGPRLSAEELTIIREHPAIFNSEEPVAVAARELARSYFHAARIRASHRREVFNEAAAHREALTKAGEELGIYRPRAKPPSEAQKGRFAGDRGGDPGGAEPVTLKLSDGERAAALTLYSESDLTDSQKFAKYAAILMKDKAYMANRKG